MRSPAKAGQWYPGNPDRLRSLLDEMLRAVGGEELPAIGAVVPHAGYSASGMVAAEVYARLPSKTTYVIIGPSHTGMGSPVALSREPWRTPLGVVECDTELADALAGTIIYHDETSHLYEHSIELQVPFLQRRFSGFRILPISMGLQDDETAAEVGEAVGEAVRSVGRGCTIIASSDFTHYEPQEVARKKDARLIEAILRMDVPEFYRRLYVHEVSACGYGPIAATIIAARILGAESGKLLRYATSGDVLGDYSQVVGYGAIVFT